MKRMLTAMSIGFGLIFLPILGSMLPAPWGGAFATLVRPFSDFYLWESEFLDPIAPKSPGDFFNFTTLLIALALDALVITGFIYAGLSLSGNSEE